MFKNQVSETDPASFYQVKKIEHEYVINGGNELVAYVCRSWMIQLIKEDSV
jgi:hypothetical protein